MLYSTKIKYKSERLLKWCKNIPFIKHYLNTYYFEPYDMPCNITNHAFPFWKKCPQHKYWKTPEFILQFVQHIEPIILFRVQPVLLWWQLILKHRKFTFYIKYCKQKLHEIEMCKLSINIDL